MIQNFEITGGKLVPAYRGPHRIILKLKNNRYIVADVEGCHKDRIEEPERRLK